jgi:mono/diheme cytochrome c family protein
MKKNWTILSIFVIAVVIINCTAPKKIGYTIPDDYTGQSRANLIKYLDQGQKLFKINCSRCHGIFTKGKDSIPNFSKTEIEAYKSAVLMDDPKNHAIAQKIRPEDLNMILEFLAFRKQGNP